MFNLARFSCFVKSHLKLFQNFFCQLWESAPLRFRSVRYNLASIFDLSNRFSNFFQSFFRFNSSVDPTFLSALLPFPGRMKFNIAPFENLSNRFWKIFQLFYSFQAFEQGFKGILSTKGAWKARHRVGAGRGWSVGGLCILRKTQGECGEMDFMDRNTWLSVGNAPGKVYSAGRRWRNRGRGSGPSEAMPGRKVYCAERGWSAARSTTLGACSLSTGLCAALPYISYFHLFFRFAGKGLFFRGNRVYIIKDIIEPVS